MHRAELKQLSILDLEQLHEEIRVEIIARHVDPIISKTQYELSAIRRHMIANEEQIKMLMEEIMKHRKCRGEEQRRERARQRADKE